MPIIATRTLTLSTAAGDQPVPIEINAPQVDGKTWTCHFTIGWPRRAKTGYGAGIDGMQALSIALMNIAAQLYTSPYHRAGQLRWDKPGDGYGFPIAKPLRHLLVGQDRAFDG
jgi:hypothetical protein